jgi:protease IV
MILAIILLILLAFSFMFNVGSLFTGGLAHGHTKYSRSSGPRLDETIIEDNDSANKIAIIEVNGIITSQGSEQSGYNMVDIIKAQLKRAQEDDHVHAVILKVDSPGGEVLASDEIYRSIKDFQDKSHKPVVASMGNLAASGGYYISSPCRWIVANELTITGSIGVIMHGWNYRGLMNKVGLLPEVYKSGKFKDMLSGERNPEDITPEERKMVQALIDETYGKFKDVVEEGRGKSNEKNKAGQTPGQKLNSDWTDYADGRVLSGKEAYKLGFVDQLGNFEDAFKRAKSLANIREANQIEYEQHYDLSDLFRLFGKSEGARVLKVDMGMEAPKLQAGQLYFLAPTFAH